MIMKGGVCMITNKKGLSDIVTTALIILLVAVAVAAIWAFIAPALRGTGTQFTKTQVCVSNIIEPLTCKTSVGTAVPVTNPPPPATNPIWTTAPGPAGNFPVTIQVRRTLTDGVAVATEFETAVGTTPSLNLTLTTDTSTTTITTPTRLGSTSGTVKIPKAQGELVSITIDSGIGSTGGACSSNTYPADCKGQTTGTSPQVQVTTTYKLPDNTIVKCPSLPITCNTA